MRQMLFRVFSRPFVYLYNRMRGAMIVDFYQLLARKPPTLVVGMNGSFLLTIL